MKPTSQTYQDLTNLPEPKGQLVASVYSFRDMTGQYKRAPNSSISTAMTQGASSMLVQALKDSGWFVVVEREGFQHLLTERKISRALKKKDYPDLLPSNIIFEGGIIAYDSNVKTGGEGLKYLGIGASEQYRVDQVTVSLRVVDVRTGRVLDTVETTKTILSYQYDFNVFKYVSFKDLLQSEVGVSVNEPIQLCAQEAIHSAVVHIIARGIKQKLWSMAKPEDIDDAVLRRYIGSVKREDMVRKNQMKAVFTQ
ncbi:MAG: CsgG/HfaB family protein [Ghiorsea sp.]